MTVAMAGSLVCSLARSLVGRRAATFAATLTETWCLADDFVRSTVARGLTPGVTGGRKQARQRAALAVRMGLDAAAFDFEAAQLLRIVCLCLCRFAVAHGSVRSTLGDWGQVLDDLPGLAEAAAADRGRLRAVRRVGALSCGQLLGLGFSDLAAAEQAVRSRYQDRSRVLALTPPPARESALAKVVADALDLTKVQAAKVVQRVSLRVLCDASSRALLADQCKLLATKFGFAKKQLVTLLGANSLVVRLGSEELIDGIAALDAACGGGLTKKQLVTLLRANSLAKRLGSEAT